MKAERRQQFVRDCIPKARKLVGRIFLFLRFPFVSSPCRLATFLTTTVVSLSIMEHVALSNHSKVPQHLRPFHQLPLTAEPRRATATNPCQLPSSGQTREVELCPPHWCIPVKRSLRGKLRDVILKERPIPHPKSSPPKISSPRRPAIMRMKDSDDYITARAANPRTGLISPSIAAATPSIECTPGTPGEALQLIVDKHPPSPTPDTNTRPALRRANEGCKVNAGTANRWRAGETGWFRDTVTGISPKVAQVKADARLASSKSRPSLKEDRFIVHMPSAHEPQPYAYPGYSAKQIEAFEHYKRKARRTSGEGYDQRVLHNILQTSASGGGSGVRKVSTGRGSPHVPAGHISVARGRARVNGDQDGRHEESCCGGAELNAAAFAPFSSPRTPALRPNEELALAMETFSPTLKCENSASGTVHRKPVDSAPQAIASTTAHSQSGVAPQHDDQRRTPLPHSLIHSGHDPRAGDLRHLPRVALVHPALASVPLVHPLRPSGDSRARKCSLGCVRNLERDICTGRRLIFSDFAPTTQRTLFENGSAHSVNRTSGSRVQDRDGSMDMQNSQRSEQILEALSTAVVSVIGASRHLQLPTPRIVVLDVLRADDTTPQQKAAALKTIISSAGQALAIITATAMLRQVGSAIIQVAEIIFWPLTVPLKILQWLAGAG